MHKARAARPGLVPSLRGLIEPLLRVGAIDRALVIGAQGFGALIPLLIVLEGTAPGDHSVGDDMVARLHVHGAAADTVRRAFTVPTAGGTTISALGAVLLVASALSFTRRLQRLYEDTWRLESRGMRGTPWGLAWLVVAAAWITIQPLPGGVVLSLAGVLLLGLLTPYLLLGRRVAWRALWLQAALTAAGATLLGAWTAIYMPRAIATSAGRYGTIGVAFALLTWLWGVGLLLVCSAVYGSRPAPPLA